MTAAPIAILGGGPVGLTLALLLARRGVPSVVVDARDLDDAKRDRRLLALSRGTLDALGTVVALPAATQAPIRTVVVSSRGEFGRAVLDEREHDGRPLGATIRYGELIAALDAACIDTPLVEMRRRCAAMVCGRVRKPCVYHGMEKHEHQDQYEFGNELHGYPPLLHPVIVALVPEACVSIVECT